MERIPKIISKPIHASSKVNKRFNSKSPISKFHNWNDVCCGQLKPIRKILLEIQSWNNPLLIAKKFYRSYSNWNHIICPKNDLIQIFWNLSLKTFVKGVFFPYTLKGYVPKLHTTKFFPVNPLNWTTSCCCRNFVKNRAFKTSNNNFCH